MSTATPRERSRTRIANRHRQVLRLAIGTLPKSKLTGVQSITGTGVGVTLIEVPVNRFPSVPIVKAMLPVDPWCAQVPLGLTPAKSGALFSKTPARS